jgi:hypothetical protein
VVAASLELAAKCSFLDFLGAIEIVFESSWLEHELSDASWWSECVASASRYLVADSLARWACGEARKGIFQRITCRWVRQAVAGGARTSTEGTRSEQASRSRP